MLDDSERQMVNVDQNYRAQSLHSTTVAKASQCETALAQPHLAEKSFYQVYGKRVVDVIVASSMMILCAPIMAATALVILWNDGAPFLFVQDRAGLSLKRFTIFKFRTMRNDLVDASASWKRSDPNWNGAATLGSADRDPRIIRGGSWLRRYSLDELPQLLNVLRGEMSIVGPRPLLCQQVTDQPGLRAKIVQRSVVRPGLTGLWQVSGRSDITFEKMMDLDLQYVDNVSFRQDTAILFKTIIAVIRGTGAI